MAGSLSNSISQACGKNAAHRPMASVITNAMPALTQVARRARSRCPAPMQVPTMATSGAPRPNTSGTSRYSSREAVP